MAMAKEGRDGNKLLHDGAGNSSLGWFVSVLSFEIHVWKLFNVVCKIRGKIHYKFYKLFPVSVFFFTHCISYQLSCTTIDIFISNQFC